MNVSSVTPLTTNVAPISNEDGDTVLSIVKIFSPFKNAL
jgi:hypothetical protein